MCVTVCAEELYHSNGNIYIKFLDHFLIEIKRLDWHFSVIYGSR
jgi:hypothetical protein